jgi:tricarballylate dehydrogenase
VIARHGVEFIQRTYYLAKGPPRIQPAGGGPAIISALTRAAQQPGVTFRYGCAARDIVTGDNRVAGLTVTQGEVAETIPCDAMILASGGFQANSTMREQFGADRRTRSGRGVRRRLAGAPFSDTESRT